MSRARARYIIIICLWVLHLICFGIYWSRKVVRTVSARRTQTEPKYLDHRDNRPPAHEVMNYGSTPLQVLDAEAKMLAGRSASVRALRFLFPNVTPRPKS